MCASYLSQMDASTALRAGSIDAWGTWQPYIALQIAQGEARVLADGSSVPRGASYLVSSTYALAGKSAAIGDFVRRLRQARHWGAAHAGNYATLYAQNTGVPLEIARRVSMALVSSAFLCRWTQTCGLPNGRCCRCLFRPGSSPLRLISPANLTAVLNRRQPNDRS